MSGIKLTSKTKADLATIAHVSGLLTPKDTSRMTKAQLLAFLQKVQEEAQPLTEPESDPAPVQNASPTPKKSVKEDSSDSKADEVEPDTEAKPAKRKTTRKTTTRTRKAVQTDDSAEDETAESDKPATKRKKAVSALSEDESVDDKVEQAESEQAESEQSVKEAPVQLAIPLDADSERETDPEDPEPESAKVLADDADSEDTLIPEAEIELPDDEDETGEASDSIDDNSKTVALPKRKNEPQIVLPRRRRSRRLEPSAEDINDLDISDRSLSEGTCGLGDESQPFVDVDAEKRTYTISVDQGSDLTDDVADVEHADEMGATGHDDSVHGTLSSRVMVQPGELASGVLEIMSDGYGFVRRENYLQGHRDVYVPPQYIRRFNLRQGDYIVGPSRQQRDNDRYQALYYIKEVNGMSPDKMIRRPVFDRLTPIYPNERFDLETTRTELSTRIIDLISPIGKGQRGMIVSPPKAGKTILLQKIANAISINSPDAKLIVLLIDERPEEVTDMQRSIKGEVVYSTFDKTPENHVKVTELVLERAMRLVELGQDVVILLDSITRMGRAYNLTINPTGRTLSGGLDRVRSMVEALFGAARILKTAVA